MRSGCYFCEGKLRIPWLQCIPCANANKLLTSWVTLENICPMPWARHSSLFFKWPVLCWQKYSVQMGSYARSTWSQKTWVLLFSSVLYLVWDCRASPLLFLTWNGENMSSPAIVRVCESREETVLYSCICSRARGTPGLTLSCLPVLCLSSLN